MSTLPILMWILLGIVLEKNITNVFTLTYPMQFVVSLLVAIFGIGPNVNATKNNKKYLVNSNIVIGTVIFALIAIILCLNVNQYITFMSMDTEVYNIFCIYSFVLLFLQGTLQLICQKLYYLDKTKHSNVITIFLIF